MFPILTYSGGDVTKMPIIGKATTIPLEINFGGKDDTIPRTEYLIVEIGECNGEKFYVANFWYKEHKRIPQILHEKLVEKFEEV